MKLRNDKMISAIVINGFNFLIKAIERSTRLSVFFPGKSLENSKGHVNATAF